MQGHGCSEDESTRFDADDQVKLLHVGEHRRHTHRRFGEPVWISQQRGDIAKEYARFRKIGNVPDESLQIGHVVSQYLTVNPEKWSGAVFHSTRHSVTRPLLGPLWSSSMRALREAD